MKDIIPPSSYGHNDTSHKERENTPSFNYSKRPLPLERSQPPEDEKKSGLIKEIIRLSLIVLLIVIPFRMFIAQPFIVNGASMDPTFGTGEYLIVDQVTYRFDDPKRGSVIVFKFPQDTSKYFIKRIIGLPGETVHIEDGAVTIENEEFPSGVTIEEPYIVHEKDEDDTWELRDDEYFVLGDNRVGSSDSRSWGPLKEEFIVGRPLVRLFPIEKLTLFPGNFSN